MALEPVLAALVTLIGIALTSFGVFTHTGTAMAPGALLAFVGRRLARQLPGPRKPMEPR